MLKKIVLKTFAAYFRKWTSWKNYQKIISSCKI